MRKTIEDLLKPMAIHTQRKHYHCRRSTWVAIFELTRYINERMRPRSIDYIKSTDHNNERMRPWPVDHV